MRNVLYRRLPLFTRLANAVADVWWPPECPLAEALPAAGRGFHHLSASVLASLPLVDRAPWCAICGHPFFGVTAGDQTCIHCRDLNPVFEDGRTVMLARGPARALVHEFKYHGGRHLAPDLARLALRAPGYLERLHDAVLVPVPLSVSKLHQRGFNQSALFAEALARLAPGAQCLDLLERARDTPSQTRLNREARRQNMRGAFVLKAGLAVAVARRHVIIDDVFTTGATLNAAAAALRAAGVMRIGVATLAHG